jgi:hypothetical protein
MRAGMRGSPAQNPTVVPEKLSAPLQKIADQRFDSEMTVREALSVWQVLHSASGPLGARAYSSFFRSVAVILVCEFGSGVGNSWLCELPIVGGLKFNFTPSAWQFDDTSLEPP